MRSGHGSRGWVRLFGRVHLAGAFGKFPGGLLAPRAGTRVLAASLLVALLGTAEAPALEVEVLTPRDGATVLARSPSTHLVLRHPINGAGAGLWIEAGKAWLEPSVAEEVQGQRYLHFELPLVPGRNVFRVVPDGPQVEVAYRQVRARVPPELDGFDFFHRGDRLPDECGACHEMPGLGGTDPRGNHGQEACAGCHRGVLADAARLHSAQLSQRCMACHQDPETPGRIGLPAAGVEQTCYDCHTGKRRWQELKYIHGPQALVGCTLCHDPHGGANRYQLWAEGSTQLCVACHSDKEDLLGGKKPVPYVHGIIPGAGCTGCHEPHASNERFLLRKPVNPLCLGCHPRIVKRLQVGHPVGRHPVAGPEELRRPGRSLTCVGCHDPHGSSYPYMLIQEPRQPDFCRVCHKR